MEKYANFYILKYGEWDLKTDDRSNMAYFEFLLNNWGGINVRVEWEKLNWVHIWVWVEILNENRKKIIQVIYDMWNKKMNGSPRS